MYMSTRLRPPPWVPDFDSNPTRKPAPPAIRPQRSNSPEPLGRERSGSHSPMIGLLRNTVHRTSSLGDMSLRVRHGTDSPSARKHSLCIFPRPPAHLPLPDTRGDAARPESREVSTFAQAVGPPVARSPAPGRGARKRSGPVCNGSCGPAAIAVSSHGGWCGGRGAGNAGRSWTARSGRNWGGPTRLWRLPRPRPAIGPWRRYPPICVIDVLKSRARSTAR